MFNLITRRNYHLRFISFLYVSNFTNFNILRKFGHDFFCCISSFSSSIFLLTDFLSDKNFRCRNHRIVFRIVICYSTVFRAKKILKQNLQDKEKLEKLSFSWRECSKQEFSSLFLNSKVKTLFLNPNFSHHKLLIY